MSTAAAWTTPSRATNRSAKAPRVAPHTSGLTARGSQVLIELVHTNDVSANLDGHVDLERLMKCLLQLAVLGPIQVGDFVLDVALQGSQKMVLVAEVKDLAALAGQVGV